jgi:hypothetical protein
MPAQGSAWDRARGKLGVWLPVRSSGGTTVFFYPILKTVITQDPVGQHLMMHSERVRYFVIYCNTLNSKQIWKVHSENVFWFHYVTGPKYTAFWLDHNWLTTPVTTLFRWVHFQIPKCFFCTLSSSSWFPSTHECAWLNTLAVLPLRRRDCDSIKKKVHYTLFMASRNRIVVALMGEAPLRTEGSPVGDCKVFFFCRIVVASPLGERPNTDSTTCLHLVLENAWRFLPSSSQECSLGC